MLKIKLEVKSLSVYSIFIVKRFCKVYRSLKSNFENLQKNRNFGDYRRFFIMNLLKNLATHICSIVQIFIKIA